MNGTTPRLLEVTNLRVVFRTGSGSATAVRDVSLHVNAGETVGIVGESGSGKSVTALSILGLLPQPAGAVASGSIRLDGEELTGKSERALARIRGNRISMIFQDPMSSLNPAFTIGAQLMEVALLHRTRKRKEARRLAVEWLSRVGIPDAEARMAGYPFQLSGGQRQRVMIAMALLCEPRLLIADEPTTALDVTIQAQILDVLHELRDRLRTAILIISHDFGVIADIAQRVVVMYAGKVMEQGKVAELIRQPFHPYTQSLLKSIPRIDAERRERLYVIPGTLPKTGESPTGCVFHPRCEYARTLCRVREPYCRLMGTDGSRSVSCWRGTTEYEQSAEG